MPRAPRTFLLTALALAQAGLSVETPLCLAPSAWGTHFTLAAGPPLALESYADTPEPTGGEVALVRICGPLSKEADSLCGWWDGYEGEDGIVERFTEACTAPEIGAIVLVFDSPGGTSSGLEEAVRRMVEIRDAMGKPVLAYVGELCASAAYWIAAVLATGGIFGPVASRIGSIGSFVDHTSLAGALAKEGMAIEFIADPPGKVAGNYTAPLDDLGRARIEREVKACTSRFMAAVGTARGLSEEALRGLDGDCLPAEMAAAVGLIDDILPLEDVLSRAALAAANPLEGSMQMNGMKTRTRPGGPRAAAGDAPPAGDGGTYAVGDRVLVTEDGAAGEVISTDCYEVQIDGEAETRLCRGAELEADGGAAAAPAGPGARAFNLALARASGLSRGASDTLITARAREMMALATFALEATGAASPSAARGVIESRFRAAAALPGIQSELDGLRAEQDQGKRIAVCEAGVVAGVWTPGKVWSGGDKSKGLSAWARAPHKGQNGEQLGQSLEQLEADLQASAPLSFAGPPAQPKASAGAHLSAEEKTLASQAQTTPEEWQRAREGVLAGVLPMKGRRKGQ